MLQEYYGKEIWAKIVHDDAKAYIEKHVPKDQSYTIVIDDWRRLIESNYFESTGDFNVIKIFLEKDGLKVKPSKGSSQYEGNITPEDCNITFKYDKTYSNFEEIIGLIQNAIK